LAKSENKQSEKRLIRAVEDDFELREMISENNANPSEVKSIKRIAALLACICNGINSLADISERTKLSRSTVHRLLKGLETSHLVIHDSVNRRYYLGSLISHLLSKPRVTHEYLINCATREMERLAAATEETVVISVKVGLNHVALYAIPSSHELRIVGSTHRSGPLYTGAGGKALLAQLSEPELKEAIKGIQFELDSPSAKDDLLAQVKMIRRQGYAVTSGERVLGATFIAAPIRGYEIPVALSIVGPDARIQPRLESFVERLLIATDRISNNITQI
jgi:DNA-binding IclR family transcriptional regulator